MVRKKKHIRLPLPTAFLGVPREAVATYAVLASYANHVDGLCWPKMETLAKALNCSPRTIQRHLSALREAGLVEFVERRRVKGRWSSYTYRLTHLAKTRLAETAPSVAPRSGFVYLVESTRGLYKIGYASDMSRRLWHLRSESVADITLIHCFESSDVVRDERALHDVYAHCRVYSEWFELSDQEVDEFCTIKAGEDIALLGWSL